MPGNQGERALISKAAKEVKPVFEGLKDLTLKTLEKLKGKTTVSKQFISDLTKTQGVTKAEAKLVNNALSGEDKTVEVKAFAEKVEDNLLPLRSWILQITPLMARLWGEVVTGKVFIRAP